VDVPGQDAAQEHLLLLLGAVADQRRADGLQRHGRQVHVGPLCLVGEDRLLDLAEPVTAVLLRPADAHPAVGAHLPDHPLVGLAVPVARPLGGGVAVLVLRGQAGEVRTDLGLQRPLGLGQLEVLGLRPLDRHVGGDRVEVVDQVGDPGEVVVQRVGLVDAHAAVQVVAGPQRLRALRAQPVRRHRQVVGGVEPLGDPPGGVVGGQVGGARGDVDVRDLHRHRLELRQRAPELGAALDVAGGQVTGAGQQAGADHAQPRDRVVDQRPGRVALEQLGRRVLEDDRVPVDPCGRGRGLQPDAGPLGVDQRHDRPVAVAGGDQQPRRVGGVADRDLAPGDQPLGVRRGGRGGERRADLAERRAEDDLAAHDAR
jgi:hypothetical protein